MLRQTGYDIEKLRAAVQFEHDWAREYVHCVGQGRYASQPEWVHMLRLHIHAARIADARGALYRAQMLEQREGVAA